jgi:hypothetical protein
MFGYVAEVSGIFGYVAEVSGMFGYVAEVRISTFGFCKCVKDQVPSKLLLKIQFVPYRKKSPLG